MCLVLLQLAPERGRLPAASDKHSPWGEALKHHAVAEIRERYVHLIGHWGKLKAAIYFNRVLKCQKSKAFFLLSHTEISFAAEWKHKQGCIKEKFNVTNS